jgi:hypothetical protein
MSGMHADVRPLAVHALAVAERLGAEPVVVHVLNTLGVAECSLGVPQGWERLKESLRRGPGCRSG